MNIFLISMDKKEGLCTEEQEVDMCENIQNDHTGNLPKISVIIGILATKEKLDLVRRAITSIQMQTYSNIEIIICLDGSDINVKGYFFTLCKTDNRIFILPELGKSLLSEKLNYCLQYTTGEYVARMDDDDVSHPRRLEYQYDFLVNNQDISFVGCNVIQIRDNKSTKKIFPEYPCIHDFRLTQPFIHPTLMFRGLVLMNIGGYCEEKRCDRCEDYDLLLRLYNKNHKGANLQKFLLEYTAQIKGNRTFLHRYYEVQTRFIRFKELGILTKYSLYVIKPLIVYFIPNPLLQLLKNVISSERRFNK